jgi:cation diffusion facilitator family transporter
MYRSIVVNILLAIVKFVFGFLTASQSIISEGVDSAMDSFNNLIAIYAIKRSHDPADADHPLGHGKVEYVASLILSFIILGVGVLLISEIFNQTSMVVIPKPTSLLVLIITTVVKVFLALYLIKQSKMIDNQLIYSLGQENLLDVLKSSIAFIGIGLSILSDFLNLEFLKYGDIVAGVIIAIFIIKSGFEIMSDSISNILGKSADEEVIKRFRTLIKSIDGVEKIEWVDIVKQGPCYLVLATILVDKTITIDAAHDIATLVDQALMATNEVIYSSIHVEPTED